MTSFVLKFGKLILPYALAFFAGVAVCYYAVRGEVHPVVERAARVVDVEEEGGPPLDPITVELPDVIYNYPTLEPDEVRFDTVYVPLTIPDSSLRLSTDEAVDVDTPLLFGDPTVRWTSYDPESRRWQTREYVVTPSHVSYGIEAEIGAYGANMSAYGEVRAYLGYKNVEGFAGYRVSDVDEPLYGPTFGVRVRLGR